MLDLLFGWRKASRCKRLIMRVQCRLKLLKNKRESIIRQLEYDVVQLIKTGKDQTAFRRVEQLSKDRCLKGAYDLLDQFCEFVIINLTYIRKNKDLPNDVGEAISSLLFASARFGDLPELCKLRKLFKDRYGQNFATTSVELFQGNLVNHQMIEKVCMKSVPDDVKFRLVKEIARDNNLQLGPPDIDNMLLLQHSQLYDASLEKCDFELEENATVKDIEVDYHVTKRDQLQLSNGLDIVGPNRTSVTTEISMHLSDRTIVYLDDIEEFQLSIKEDVVDKDQRLFMFKQAIPSNKNANVGLLGYYQDSMKDDLMDISEASDSKKSSRGSSHMKRSETIFLKRRYLSLENQKQSSPMLLLTSSKLDTESSSYYGKSDDSSPDGSVKSRDPRHRKKHQRKVSAESIGSAVPCHRKSKPITRKSDARNLVVNEEGKLGESEGMDFEATYVSSRSSSTSRAISPQTPTRGPPSYTRAITMPPERPQRMTNDIVLRSVSFQSERQNQSGRSPHVHPKLPDYDDLAAIFKAIKKETIHLNSTSGMGTPKNGRTSNGRWGI